MKTVLSCLGTALIVGISLSADNAKLSYADYEKQLADYQGRDQKLREEIAREQVTILDVKNRIESSRKNIDDLRRKKLETLGITSGDVDAAIGLFDRFTQDISIVLNQSESDFKNDSIKAVGFRGRLDSLLSYPACRLKIFAPHKQSASGLVLEVEKRLGKLTAEAAAKITPPATISEKVAPSPDTATKAPYLTSSGETATYVVRSSGGKPETLFDIAEQVYGNAYLWPRIYQANKANIDNNFNRHRKDPGRSHIVEPPDLIIPGQVLVIPR